MPRRKQFKTNKEYNKWFQEYREKNREKIRAYNKKCNWRYRNKIKTSHQNFGVFMLKEIPIKDDTGRIIAMSESYDRLPLFEEAVFKRFYKNCYDIHRYYIEKINRKYGYNLTKI